jgi:hypothetical protein
LKTAYRKWSQKPPQQLQTVNQHYTVKVQAGSVFLKNELPSDSQTTTKYDIKPPSTCAGFSIIGNGYAGTVLTKTKASFSREPLVKSHWNK